MVKMPKFSIVTPSFNQGKFIAETIKSLMAQDYPYLEHIVIDGGSTDQTPSILKRYPHLIVVSEPDHGQAEAINKGFGLAAGEIWGFLNSDDTLLPGALKRVAQEIDQERGRHIVMGRCRFIDENGDFTGIEHPSHFESHRRILAIWKGYTIPQPAVFWTPEVWKSCGLMNENLHYGLDYDLFCRFSQKYRFHFVDEVLATYRLHPESKTEHQSEKERLEHSIRISKQYWGSPLSLQHWQLFCSLAWYRIDRVGKALKLYRIGQEYLRQTKYLRGSLYALMAGLLAPEVAFYVGVFPFFRKVAKGILVRIFDFLPKGAKTYPQTGAYMDHTEPWDDGWVGPRSIIFREGPPGAEYVYISGWANLRFLDEPLYLAIFLDGKEIGKKRIEKSGGFKLELSLYPPISGGNHKIEIHSSTWFVPHRFRRNGDYRPLSFRMEEIHL
jgi:glycosyltransferase involved in cell wall biosynthesis